VAPIRFAFGLHLHQPVGNFDHVFAQHVDDVYRPLLDALTDREFFPVVLHLSGPLIEWLESHEPAYLDRLGRLVADGRIEILLAGFYEPVLA
jgi:alpha-amylase